MAGKFKLVPNPTFTSVVSIPTAGEDEPVKLEVTFKHMTIKALSAMQKDFEKRVEKLEKVKDSGDAERKLMVEFLLELVAGWELEEPFDEDSINTALDFNPRFFDSITTAYQSELWGVRQK